MEEAIMTAPKTKSSKPKSAKAKSSKPKAAKAKSSQRTIDHDAIRQWAEERKGKPATVIATERGGKPGILRIDFPGHSGEGTLDPISWEDFFNKFECANLAMVYEDKTADGETSYFCKFVNRESSD